MKLTAVLICFPETYSRFNRAIGVVLFPLRIAVRRPLSTAGLLVFVLPIILCVWIRSRIGLDYLIFSAGRTGTIISSGNGVLYIALGPEKPPQVRFDYSFLPIAREEMEKTMGYDFLGWKTAGIDIRPGDIWPSIWIRYPTIFTITAAIATIFIRREARKPLHTKHETCVNCGYDLRATPDRCPECGTMAANGTGPNMKKSADFRVEMNNR